MKTKKPRFLRATVRRCEPVHLTIDERDLAQILAALRYWQKKIPAQVPGCVNLPQPDFGMPHFDEWAPLAAIEIDRLCEKLTEPEPVELFAGVRQVQCNNTLGRTIRKPRGEKP